MTDFLLDLVGPLLLLSVFVFIGAVMHISHQESQAARLCRENLAKLETSRSAADIAQLCK